MNIEQVYKARQIIKDIIKDTPINYVKNIIDDTQLYIKLESLQHTGSFKIRGAYNKIFNLSENEKLKGIICASAGNHAQGVAYAAQLLGINATIVMPLVASLAKIDATRNYGAEVILYGNSFDEAYQKAKDIQTGRDLFFIEPFDDEEIIAGQGTIGLEILEKLPDLDAVFVPIGGGGLAAGIALAIKSLSPKTKIYGVAAESANSMSLSIKENKVVPAENIDTIADGIAVKRPGKTTLDLCKKYLDEIVTVSDTEIASALLLLIEKMKSVSEGAGATSLAGALKVQEKLKNQKICCVISGGNIDVSFLSKLIDRALKYQGRKFIFETAIIDKPGSLSQLIELISKTGANIVSVIHDRLKRNLPHNKCLVEISVETFDNFHIELIIETLEKKGYFVEVK